MVSKYISAHKTLRESGSRKIWVKPTDQMDLWLDSQGYYRKHTAKDGSCLYRAVSEQIFLAQSFHLDLRRQCAEFASRHPELLSNVVHCSPSEYVEQMKHPYESGGRLELELMSLMYRKDFSLFREVGKLSEPVTFNGFKNCIQLCLSQDRHYDSVYTKQYINNAAFCQSIVYETLYKGVFELLEVDFAVKKMLHDKNSKYQRDPSSFLMNGLALRLEVRDSYMNVKELLNIGVTPFPYKVAKSLDPDIYRNVEYDTWNDIRRGLRYGSFVWNNRELQVGVKCIVRLQPEQVYHAHIQEMAPDKGPVIVFIEELGQKMTVPYEKLELLPQPSQPSPVPLPVKQLKQLQSLKVLSVLSQDALSQEAVTDNEMQVAVEAPANQESERDRVWRRPDLDTDGRATPKLKMFSESSKSNKKSSKNYRIKAKEHQQHASTESNKNKMECSSVVSSSNSNNYQHQQGMNYHQDSFEEYTYIHQQEPSEQAMEEVVETRLAEAAYVPPTTASTLLCLEPPHYYIPSADVFHHSAFCYMPHKPDLPELPVTDVAPMRYFYNYGFDPFSRGVRPTPPCYLNTAVAYMTESNSTTGVFGQGSLNSPSSTPDSAVVMSPVYAQRPDSLPVLPSNTSEPDTSFHMHNLAPRFKNKMRAAQVQTGRICEAPVVQQPEVSSTTNVLTPVTHYIPPPQPPPPSATHPLYYHPLEYEGVYYPVFDPNTTAPTMFYPHPHPQPLPIPAPTHYIHPDALFYQHIVAAPLPSAV